MDGLLRQDIEERVMKMKEKKNETKTDEKIDISESSRKIAGCFARIRGEDDGE